MTRDELIARADALAADAQSRARAVIAEAVPVVHTTNQGYRAYDLSQWLEASRPAAGARASHMPQDAHARSAHLNRPAETMTRITIAVPDRVARLARWIRERLFPAPKLLAASWLGVVLAPYPAPVPGEVASDPLPLPPDDLGRLNALRTKRHAPLVRIQNTGSSEDMMRMLTLMARGYSVLSCVPYGRGYGPIARGMAIQIGDAVDVAEPAVDPEEYGQLFRATYAQMRVTVPADIPIVTAGFSTHVDRSWLARALAAGASDADAICVQIVGDVPSIDLISQWEKVYAGMHGLSPTPKPFWVTTLRCTNEDPSLRARRLSDVLTNPQTREIVDRCYLDAEDADALVAAAIRAS